MQPKDLRLATERDLENSIGAATAPLDQRLEDLEVSAGFTPGDINDTTAASLIRNPESETATELSAAIGDSIAESLPYRNVKDYGAVGDGITDDRASIQAALDAAGDGGVVQFSAHKRYRVAGTLITNIWQRMEGVTSAFNSGSSSPVEIVFDVSGSTPGIRARSYTHLKNLLIRGPGDAVGSCVGVEMYDSLSNAISMEDTSIDNWAVGAHLDQVYYGKFLRPAFRRNAVGLKITASLNISIFGIHLNGQRADGSPGIGVQGAARALSLFGGSIEQCRTFTTMTNNETLNIYGVYFETTVGAGLTDIVGVLAAGANDITINAHGCYVYMPFIKSWIDTRTSTGSTLNARGNSFIAGAGVESPTDAVAYRFTAGQIVDIGGDNWKKVEKAGIVYFGVVDGAFPALGTRLTMPAGHPLEGLTYDGRMKLSVIDSIAHSVAGPAAVSLAYEHSMISLTADMPSISFIGTGQHRQRIEITVIQDAIGGRVYGFNGTCRFAGGVAPINTTANTRTTVGLQYDAVTGRWHETHRSVAVPN